MIKRMFQKKSKAVGFVEKITPHVITGWLLDGGQAASLLLIIEGHSVSIPIRCTERQDVAQAHGRQHRQAGFEAIIPVGLQSRLRSLDSKPMPKLRIQHQGITLPLAQDAWDGVACAGHLDRCEGFLLEGWASINGRRPQTLTIRCGGKDYPLRPVWVKRDDAAQSIGAE